MTTQTGKTAKPRNLTQAQRRRRFRNRLYHVVDLAVERLDLDLACVDAYALRKHDRALGLRGSTSAGVRAVERYTSLDDHWTERREQLPAELTGAFEVALALVRVAAATMPLPDEPEAPA